MIVTVPAWWNQFQRRAYRDALELQGLSCLAMVGEGTGVALNYAMTRTFPTFDPATGEGEKEYHLIYDSGALSTTATVVAFWQTSVLPTPKSKTSINTTHIEVLGAGWENVGGVMLDLNIQEVLVEDFIQKSGKQGVREDKRAMAKLAREANRVKQILSANQETSVGVSGSSYPKSMLICTRWSLYMTTSIIGHASLGKSSKPLFNRHSPSSRHPLIPRYSLPIYHSRSSPLSSSSAETPAFHSFNPPSARFLVMPKLG